MADITDSQHIADDTVAITVNGVYVLLDIIFYHGSLEFRALIGVKTYIICILVIIQSRHIKLSGGAA